MRRETVRSATSMSSFKSSPWMRGAPQRVIRVGHLPDQGGDLGIDARTTSGSPTRELDPVLAEAAALPAQDGVGRDDDQRLPPTGPDSGQAGPKQAVGLAEPRPRSRSFVDGGLLAEGQVLESGLAQGHHGG